MSDGEFDEFDTPPEVVETYLKAGEPARIVGIPPAVDVGSGGVSFAQATSVVTFDDVAWEKRFGRPALDASQFGPGVEVVA